MENCIDDFIRQSRADDAKGGFIKKTARRIKKLRERLRIADRMEELKTLALEANTRRQRYNIDDWKPTTSTVAFDPRVRARPDMTELLNNFQLKLGMRDPDTSRARKVEDIIEELRQHLKEKRV
ncbi:hypothetical protein TRIUR3_03859 [Triticum urartu]|uniref:Uncharacterized protein n=1 Tax=Triticum urartu TaxID=4572 RepID=M8A1E4_TRIUA|nr:hypothetical protein TRIUR3_03859 [Triticum urartu]